MTTGTPPRTIAYVGSRTSRHRDGRGHGIEVFDVDGERWMHTQTIPLSNPSYLVLSPRGRAIYSVHGDSTDVRVLAIDPLDGSLRATQIVDSGGVNPVHLAVTPDCRHLIVANHNSGTVAALPINEDDSLGPVANVLELVGEVGPHRRDQNGAKPHQIVFDPSGRFVIVPDKGLDSVFILEVDEQGHLSMDPGRTVRLREMSGPRHLVFHPDGSAAYSIEEFRSTVTRYAWDSVRGTLAPRQIVSSLPEDMTTDSRGAEISIDVAGRHLYVSNRGGAGDHIPGGYAPDTIGVFSLDGHRLSGPRWTPTLGIRPRFFTPSPDGSQLFVAHERGHSIAVHDLDSRTGLLSEGRIVASTGSPVSILFHQLTS